MKSSLKVCRGRHHSELNASAILAVVKSRSGWEFKKHRQKESVMPRLIVWLLLLFLFNTTGCLYYQEYRQKKGEADYLEERTNVLKNYRLCIEEHSDEPEGAKGKCKAYGEMIRGVEVDSGQGTKK
jgi:hypothetical protein